MLRTNISPAIYQEFLDSASNAAAKGQAQYFTPPAWATALAEALPRFRTHVLDLHCGAGHLLHGCARGSTECLLGCDIDPCDGITTPSSLPFIRITGDAALVYPLARQIQFKADCFVLNPPWDLHQYRSRLETLAESDLPSVRDAFAAHDGRCPTDTIDSTVAAMCIALDLMSEGGEGFVIANESTLQRLILGPAAPHAALSVHCWAHLVITGNICTVAESGATDSAFQTGILYFARAHEDGLPPSGSPLGSLLPQAPLAGLQETTAACASLHKHRLDLRQGVEIRSYNFTPDAREKWRAVAEEWRRLHAAELATKHDLYNLWIAPDNTIQTHLSLYDQAVDRFTADQARALHELRGKHPMQLVIQRAHRRALEQAAFGKVWRVDPALQQAVHDAIAKYNEVRAPLYPLPPIQRLGYLDEQDHIRCIRPLKGFKPDNDYELRSATILVKRTGFKVNLAGLDEEVEWNGQELAFFIRDESGHERVFMEARLREKNVTLSITAAADRPDRICPVPVAPSAETECELLGPVDFDLHQLIHHFEIPEVPDIAAVNPQAYQNNLRLLREIEELTA